MPHQHRDVSPGLRPRTVRTAQGVLEVPADWELLPPGDAALTRRVKLDGPCWVVSERKGRKVFSHGVWAPAERIARVRAALDAERQDPAYERRLAQGRQRRAAQQVAYVADFELAVRQFLAFAPRHDDLARRVAAAVAAHATPVGSGTVARTGRIPVAERAAAAVIAWLRHQTTGYDTMHIARVKGRRREVRRELAQQSHRLLDRYRRGEVVAAADCALERALRRSLPAGGQDQGGDPAAGAAP